MAVTLHQILHHRCMFFSTGLFPLNHSPARHHIPCTQLPILSSQPWRQAPCSSLSCQVFLFPTQGKQEEYLSTGMTDVLLVLGSRFRFSWQQPRTKTDELWNEAQSLQMKYSGYLHSSTTFTTQKLWFYQRNYIGQMFKKKKKVNKIHFSSIDSIFPCHDNFQNFRSWICTHHMLQKISRNFNVLYEPQQQSR